ncbi:tigger transposable element-derived protein 6-like [Panonychus citri]|uniref:tigger transposable element-derived protein 6-like n=1 Tax=Panonychus citri TaxID=50023 RepID=UPI0023078CF4|nr:tigger transposable element-derived protein 6-like [Panonychus citri]
MTIAQKSYYTEGADKNGVKASKERVTILICVGINGKKKDPLVIGKSKKPRSLAKIFMIPRDIISIINKKVLLFIDNCRPHHVSDPTKYRDIKIVYLPVNTTSHCQPLDAGIINAFKHHYFSDLNCVLATLIPTGKTIDDLTKTITLREAIEWIQQALEKVTQSTIINCFTKCHFYPCN